MEEEWRRWKGTQWEKEKLVKAADVNWSLWEGTFRLEIKEETHAS